MLEALLTVLMALSVWTPQRLLDALPGSALRQSLICGWCWGFACWRSWFHSARTVFAELQTTDFHITPPPVIRMDDVGWWWLTTGLRSP